MPNANESPFTKEKQSRIERQTIEQLYPKDQMFLKQYLESIVAWLERLFG